MPNKGFHHKEESKIKMSRTKKHLYLSGKLTIWNKGFTKQSHPSIMKISKKLIGTKLTDKTKQKISLIQRGKITSETTKRKMSTTHSRLWQTTEYAKKHFQAIHKTPNKTETALIEIIKNNNLPYLFVGDGKFIIETFNPDFIQTNGKKKIIEIFSEYHHKLPKVVERDKRRFNTYLKFGYDTLVIWSNSLRNKWKREDIVKEILEFDRRTKLAQFAHGG